LIEFLNATKKFQNFTSDISDLKSCDLVYISCDVPTNSEGTSDTRLIEDLLILIQQNLKVATIVILSQVYPGFTRKISQISSCNIFYQVETLIFGDAVHRSQNQTRIIIGSKSKSDELPPYLIQILKLYNCPIFVFDFETAELTKVAINSFLASDVALTNTLAEFSEKINADWGNIVEALVLDQRIGAHRYLKPGLGISGGNIERDLKTLLTLSSQLGVNDNILKAIVSVNQYHLDWAFRKLRENYILDSPQKNIGILGLTYKENTNSLKNSPALRLIEQLPKTFRISAYDPVIKSLDLIPEYPISLVASPVKLIQESDVILIMTPWDEFRSVFYSVDSSDIKGKILIDPFRIFIEDSKILDQSVYITIGSTQL
jgi:UDPglucose 6-dehydrogenase